MLSFATRASSIWTWPLSASSAAARMAAFAILVLLSSLASASTLPYTPTTILLPSSADPAGGNVTSKVAYIITPNGASCDLVSMNISTTLRADALHTQTLTSRLPFYDTTGKAAFSPSISDNGTIFVYSGTCSSSTSSSLWTYVPSNTTVGNPAWVKHAVASTAHGPSFLGASLSFSTTLAPALSPPVIYAYGGMCPSANVTASAWQWSATYSNSVQRVSPGAASSSDPAYAASVVTARGAPIAQAGFSFTALTPSVSNRSGTITQQVNHVVLGGHTQQAFINMSMAAVWSLPEEAWNFVTISPPAATSNTELAIRGGAATSVDSRSGHTAVLSEDGSSLVVLGGWVGDISQAASPQLAVLEMGAGFDNWQWSVPAAQPSGAGIYGHGAALLPGNVMLVYGGYTIGSAKPKLKSRQSGTSTPAPMFLNLTSMSWSNSYTNPAYAAAGGLPPSSAADSGSSSRSKQIGLGVGLGLGIPLFLAVIVACFCLGRRWKRTRDSREDAVRNLAQDATRFLHNPEDDEMAERPLGGGIFPWNGSTAREWYTGGHDPYMRAGQRSLGYETLRGSSSAANPGSSLYPYPQIASSSTSGIGGRPKNARGLYQPTPLSINSYDFQALGGPGQIGPIYEDDEDEEGMHAGGDLGVAGPLSPDGDDATDPFMTPVAMTPVATTPTGNSLRGVPFPFAGPSSRSESTPSPECVRGQDREVQDWVSDVDAADAVLVSRIGPHRTTTTPATAALASTGSGAIAQSLLGGPPLPPPTRRSGAPQPPRSKSSSPVREDDDPDSRTGSNLSDSARSAFTAGHASSSSRSGSVRSHFRAAFGGNPPGVTAAATEARLGTASSSSGSSAHTWSTARSNFASLQAEGPGLLLLGAGTGAAAAAAGAAGAGGGGGGVGGERGRNALPPLTIGRDSPSVLAAEHDGSYNNTYNNTNNNDDDYLDAPGSPSKQKPRRGGAGWLGSLRRVFSTSGGGYSGSGGSGSGSASPTRGSPLGGDFESRLVGMGPEGVLLRRKQGREAWVGGEGGSSAAAALDDWDVERAVEQRLVQVMFTVPKERLRVVNPEIVREEEEVVVVDPDKEEDIDIEEEEAGQDEEQMAQRVEPRARGGRYRRGEEEEEEDDDYEKVPRHSELARSESRREEDGGRGKGKEKAAEYLLAPEPDHGGGDDISEGRLSTSDIMTAEAVRFERPRTRVLEMVESIESKSSRENSPASSPKR